MPSSVICRRSQARSTPSSARMRRIGQPCSRRRTRRYPCRSANPSAASRAARRACPRVRLCAAVRRLPSRCAESGGFGAAHGGPAALGWSSGRCPARWRPTPATMPAGLVGCANSYVAAVSCRFAPNCGLGTVTLPLPTAKVPWCCRNSPTSRRAARFKCSCCSFAATPPRTWRSWSYATNLPSSDAKPHVPGWSRLIGPCSPRSAACCPGPAGHASSSSPTPCCAGTGGWSPARGPTRTARSAGRRWTRRSNN
jgi:hypothetical protein